MKQPRGARTRPARTVPDHRPAPLRFVLLCGLALLACATAARAQSAADQPRFDILEFLVEGDTLIGAAAIERAVYPFLGPGRAAADAESARKALQKAYQDAGFLSVIVVLPPQPVAGGALRLVVLPAPVDRLRVTGAQHFLPSAVREAVPSLAPGSVPNFNEMQQQLASLARATPDREITPLVAASERPNALDVELKVQDQLPLHGAIEINDKQSLNTEAGRLEASLSYDNLWQRQHAIGLNWLYSPRRPEQANILTLSYHLPLGGEGDRLYAMLTHSDSNTPTALGGQTVSRGDTWRLRWRDALAPRAGLDHALSWGLTLRDLQDRNVDVAGVTTTPSALRYPSFSAGYELDLASAAVPGRSSRAQAELLFGLPALARRNVPCFAGDTQSRDQFACKRAGASAAFQVLGLTLQQREPLGRGWVSGRLQAQLSANPLVPAEQVVYGGSDSVRGYFEGEQAGDQGLALRLEGGGPSWALAEGASLHALGFADAALLHRHQALPGERSSTTMASAGLGLRLRTGFGLQASLDWAYVLRATTRQDALGLVEALTPRGGHWGLSVRQAF
ncbi:Hemolysin activation/secretion protein [Rubrivivax sp. A210]|uniref:ShlB/FhaC/HecB family hemolysin secretion/activation protein n=1 Tax=Rubrivivax sp. A210 TaxID=2772301 RepID=UPI001917E976|nr:ShlB/FhaC/HecB family hemolysin secretion/activation protein [Rubrivivax sp. A210]CAD5373509.1 Hemolysin activation/secretion protein [Rubrivivax sp. A210]